MARLLDRNGVKYQANKSFETINKEGNRNHRQVDFWLETPLSVQQFDFPIQAIEVKSGKLNKEQQEDLRNAGIYTDIVTPNHIINWEIYGFRR